ncbi:MAG: S8 family serine peptidase [Acidimicrobiales bacterium]
MSRRLRLVAVTLLGGVLTACPSMSDEGASTTTTSAAERSTPDPTVAIAAPPLTLKQKDLLERVLPSPQCPAASPRRPAASPLQVEVEVSRVLDSCLVLSYERVSLDDLDARLDELLAEPEVVAASPLTYEVTPTAFVESEATSKDQWALEVLKAPSVTDWNWPRGSTVRVAVLDSGVADHGDLEDRVVERWNPGGSPRDHGTHVAGIVAAALGNRKGSVGFAPGVEILDATVTPRGSVAGALNWAVNERAQVVNMSFSMGALSQQEIEAAVGPSLDPKSPWASTVSALALAQKEGVVLVAAAGNCGDLSDPQPGCSRPGDKAKRFIHNARIMPAVYPGAIVVSNTDRNDRRSATSSQTSDVDVAAPGDRIVSLAENSGTTEMTGTSMAAPHVAAAAAILLSGDGPLAGSSDRAGRSALVGNVLRTTSVDLGALGRDDAFGTGRLDINAALKAAKEYTDTFTEGSKRRLRTVLVIDVSPSMQDQVPGSSGRKVDAALKAALDLVDLARVDQSDGDEHLLGVVVFGGTADVLIEPTADLDRVKKVLQNVDIMEATNVAAGLESGGEQAKVDGPSRSLVLLSDGASNRGLTQGQITQDLDRLRGDAGVVVHTVAFAKEGSIDDRFLCDIATATNGTCAQAETTIDLRRAFVASHHATSGELLRDRTIPVPEGLAGTEPVLLDEIVVPGGVAELRLSLVPDAGRLQVLLTDPRDRTTEAGESQDASGAVNSAVGGPAPGRWKILIRPAGGAEVYPNVAAVVASVRAPQSGPEVETTTIRAGAAAAGGAAAVAVMVLAVPWPRPRRRLPLGLALALIVGGGIFLVV